MAFVPGAHQCRDSLRVGSGIVSGSGVGSLADLDLAVLSQKCNMCGNRIQKGACCVRHLNIGDGCRRCGPLDSNGNFLVLLYTLPCLWTGVLPPRT
jgi:hypothetical protein